MLFRSFRTLFYLVLQSYFMLLLLLLDFCSTQNQTVVFVVDFFGVVLGGKAIVFLDQFVLQFGTFRLNRAVRERLNSIHDAGTGKVLVLLAVRIHAPEFVHGVDIVGNSVVVLKKKMSERGNHNKITNGTHGVQVSRCWLL